MRTPYLLPFESMFARAAIWQEACMMGMCQQQLMGLCQQLRLYCNQNYEGRGVGAHVAPELYPMCKWLCKCTFVGLGVNVAPVHAFT